MPRLTCHHGYFQPLGGSALCSDQDHGFRKGDGCNIAPCRGGFCYLLLGPFCPRLISLLLVGEGLREWKPISLLFIPGHSLGGEERGSSFSQSLQKAISPAFLKAVKLRLSNHFGRASEGHVHWPGRQSGQNFGSSQLHSSLCFC